MTRALLNVPTAAVWRGAVLALSLVVLALAPRVAQAQGALDLRDADLRSFVEIVSEATGRNFVIDPQVRGTVTVLAPGSVSPAALYEIFLNVLEVNRLTIVEGVDSDRIVPLNTARELAPGSAGGGEYETRAISVRHIPVSDVIEVIRPLLPAEAVVTAVPQSRLIILSDRVGNHRRIQRLISELDQPREEPIEVIRLRNADANEVLQIVQAMGIVPDGAGVSVDTRSNALVVRGSAELKDQIRGLAGRFDVDRDPDMTRVIQVKYAQATTLADVVLRSFQASDGLTDGVRIVPETGTNTLLVTAPSSKMGAISQLVAHLDRRPSQVLVEAVIFEMSVDGFSDLAVQFGAVLNDAIVGGVQFTLGGRPSLTSLVSTVLNGDTADPGSGGVIGGRHGDSKDGVVGLLTAIAQTQTTRLLSTPSIMTLNGQEAEIVVAQNVPFVTGSFTQVGEGAVDEPFQTIERQDVGLTLNVTPQINADGTVRMVIKQEVSNLTNATSSAGGEITAKRALSTTVLVRDGNVIMLGGLLENGFGTNSQAVPGLSKLPLVGGLFRGKSGSRNQRVLLVMLRPRVVNSDSEAEALTRQQARAAKAASLALQPDDSARFPQTPLGALPFDGVNLNQPFDAGFVDPAAEKYNYPPLPSRLKFGE